MAYRITGLSPDIVQPLRGLSDDELAQRGARRMTATSKPGFPCRVTLEDAEPGESVYLFPHVTHAVHTPFRSSFAIFVRDRADVAADYIDSLPPVMMERPLGLAGYDRDGMMAATMLAQPGEADRGIADLFARPDVAYIQAHNAAAGCFCARIERFDGSDMEGAEG